MSDFQSIGVVGAGAFGTALAIATARAGRAVVLWARNPDLAAALEKDRENAVYLPGPKLAPDIAVTADLARVAACDVLLLVVPAQTLRPLCERLAPLVAAGTPLVSCAKGIEQESDCLMTEVLAAELPGNPAAVLSGPTFAIEVARGLPSAVTLAASDEALGRELVVSLGSRSFRPYLSMDPVGAQVGGAVKNVLAIACGIVTGRALGDNARAALITRGLAEIGRLGLAKGGRRETLMGLSGLGDLTLTCGAMQSRNYSLGVALGEGRGLTEILAERRSVAEGVYSAAAVNHLARKLELDMPITAAVDDVLNRGADIEDSIGGLLARPFKYELS
ncbi:MAG TPA: NAD(P)H-dependent glycerol-3-phosphate dehydrogenase [Kiloniellaceae bacterium]|nr:NAD(P)H-dependent glycerol-3-phosphate dehydrogenase [Kiloniellaceae bacterium]